MHAVWPGTGAVWSRVLALWRRIPDRVAALAAERSRVVLWTPVALGMGIALYFAQGVEPPVWGAPTALALALAMAWMARRWPAAVHAALACGLVAAGAGLAQWRSLRAAAPVLVRPWSGDLIGRVVAVEIRPEARRVILDRVERSGHAAMGTPERVRVILRGDGPMPVPGTRIALRARLVPPPEPVAPGAYDFARWAWFERIGAVGSSRAPPRVISADDVGHWRLRLNAARAALVARVLAADPGPAGQITAALLTGEMGHIDPGLMAAMRDSGLAHLLSISGLHITLVAGIVFFALRRALALVPPIALRWPTKKIAAVGAFAAITGYMLFAAPGVPTTRAWLMGSAVLLAVLIDRGTVPMRLVAWAAVAVLVITPEALLGASFQMSFAAVVALIATWEVLAPMLQRWRARLGVFGRGGLLFLGALATTLVASCATAPFALYHFNRFALFSIAANLIAVPLTSFVVMPAAILVFLGLPFGWEAWPLLVMNAANAGVALIAAHVAGWPNAALPVPSMPEAGFAATVLGGLWLSLWRLRWRLLGVPAIVAGLVSPFLAAPPDLLVGPEARPLGIRLESGGLAIQGSGHVQMARDTWLRRQGVGAAAPWPAAPIDSGGCGAELCWLDRPGHVVAIVTAPRALALACAHATLLVTPLEIWRDCPAPRWIFDRPALRRAGGLTIRLRADGDIEVQTVRATRGARPWVVARDAQ